MTRGFGQHRFECSEDDCHCDEFVIGGPEPHDTDEMPAVRLPDEEKP